MWRNHNHIHSKKLKKMRFYWKKCYYNSNQRILWLQIIFSKLKLQITLTLISQLGIVILLQTQELNYLLKAGNFWLQEMVVLRVAKLMLLITLGTALYLKMICEVNLQTQRFNNAKDQWPILNLNKERLKMQGIIVLT